MMIYNLILNYLLKKRYFLFGLYVVYLFIVISFVTEITIIIGFAFYFNLDYQNMPGLIKSFPVITVCVLLIVSVVSGLKLIQHNYKTLEQNKALETQFLETQLRLKEQELRFLKMQIHPHFLFNSLNTIYGFALKKRNEAPEMILKLSNLLDYILYQIEKPKVSLEDELNHLDDYIALEKMRFHDTLQVHFKKGDYNKNTYIAPMLLIPFVENSFKHGSIVKEYLIIHISLMMQENILHFQMRNSTVENVHDREGIGLKNIQKRLEMLYPGSHVLKISQREGEFKIYLEIDVNGLKTNTTVNES